MTLDVFSLKGKKAMITGGCSGIGRCITEVYLDLGAEVCIIDYNDNIEEVAKEIGNREGKVCGLKTDVSDRKQLEENFHKAVEMLGGLDILVTCAGVQNRKPFMETTSDKWDWLIEINLRSVYFLCQLAADHMIKQKSGKMINIASMTSFVGGINSSAYAISKGGIAQMTKALSNELACHNINVNAIAPGYIATPINEDFRSKKENVERIEIRIPMKRWGTPYDMTGAAVFLASEAAAYMSGAIVPVDGGFLGA